MTLQTTRIGTSDLDITPLVLGGNVFGWTADRDTSFAVLDGFIGGGGILIDTADGYSAWAPGHTGGESERIIGEWIAARGGQGEALIATKVSQKPDRLGLSAGNVKIAAQESLERLGTETIDLYYAHFDDAQTPILETATAFSALVDEGLVRHIGLSNYSPERIDEWFAVAAEHDLHRPVALQPHYNLVERGFEHGLRSRAERYELGVLPYWGLASGFLTGKYRDGAAVDSARVEAAGKYLDERGRRVLSALDEISREHGGTPLATIALAWLAEQATVVAPIASARVPEQLPALLASMSFELTAENLQELAAASR